MKKIFNKNVIVLLLSFVMIICLILKQESFKDTISYKGKTYVNLEYNMDIFTYGFNSNEYYEEDIIHPIKHKKWDAVYFDGDLYILDKQVKEAKKYYKDDNNYEWFIVFDINDEEVKKSISISKEELKYLYDMENKSRKDTMKFDDIKGFASIKKISKDNTVYALISLANYKDSWYYKTEVMNDNDEEYIIDLPESLNKKIFDLRDSI
ncbi:MAG: hypothetical protein E7157_05595 [Lactobacillales bacterium]|nr:hypothetical protein [Lactobacillales bacterium]